MVEYFSYPSALFFLIGLSVGTYGTLAVLYLVRVLRRKAKEENEREAYGDWISRRFPSGVSSRKSPF